MRKQRQKKIKIFKVTKLGNGTWEHIVSLQIFQLVFSTTIPLYPHHFLPQRENMYVKCLGVKNVDRTNKQRQYKKHMLRETLKVLEQNLLGTQ